MLEIHVTISCPDLLAAANALAKCAGVTQAETATRKVTAEPEAPKTVVPAPAPNAFTAPIVPLAQAPSFTLEQISRAGAELITANPGVLPQVNAMLGQFGVQTLDKLPPEHYGTFATALRGLGAKI